MRREIDWNRCLEDMEAILPEIQGEMGALNNLYETDIRFLAEVGEYPPHIRVSATVTPWSPDENPLKIKEFEKKEEEMIRFIKEIGIKYGLWMKRQKIGLITMAERARQLGVGKEDLEGGPYKRWGPMKRKNCFTLKPNYQDYIIS